RRVVNLYLGCEFLSLVGPGTGNAAAFMVLDLPENLDFIGLGLKKDMPVTLAGGGLQADGVLTVDCRQARPWQGREPAALRWTREGLSWTNVTALGQAIGRWGVKDGWGDTRAGYLEQLRAAFLGWESGSLEGAVKGLLGYGPGLTPGGDDLLLGLLAATGGGADYQPYLEGFRGAIATNLGRTNEISAFFLRWALAEDYHEYLQEVVYAVINGMPALVNTAARNLLGLGATSGTDIARGIYLGFSWVFPGAPQEG
ncbi:MAG: hypothetical protein PWQ18_1370, partial [Clostridia bacterium]|nr:hypothetical protein [Clostridia bacterium]